MSERPSVAPYLFYESVQGAVTFMEEAFGFKVIFTSPDPSGQGLAHAQMAHQGGVIMIGHAGEGGLNLVARADKLPKLHAGTYVFVEDVDAHCQRAKAGGAKVLLEPADQPWGDRMYCATDPEGQFWMFARALKRPGGAA